MKHLLFLVFSLILNDLSSQEIIYESEQNQNASCFSIINDRLIIGGVKGGHPFLFEINEELQLLDESEIINNEIYNSPMSLIPFYENEYLTCLYDGSIYLYFANDDTYYPIENFQVEDIQTLDVSHIKLMSNKHIFVDMYFKDGVINSTLSIFNIKYDSIQAGPDVIINLNYEWTHTKAFAFDVKSVLHDNDGIHIWAQTDSELIYNNLDYELNEISSTSINYSNELIQIVKSNDNNLIGLFHNSDSTSVITKIDTDISMDNIFSLDYRPDKLIALTDSLFYTGTTMYRSDNFMNYLDLEVHRIQLNESNVLIESLFQREDAEFIDFKMHNDALWIIANSVSDVSVEETAIVVKIKDELLTSKNQYISETNIKLYPNPAQNQITLSSDLKIQNLTLIDQWGHIFHITKEDDSYSISHLAAGLYYVLINGNQVLKNPIFISRN